jgi:hypothetical protein
LLSDPVAVPPEAVRRTRESADTRHTGRAFRVVVGLILAGALILHISASLFLRGLFGDGPAILFEMLRPGPFVLDEPARWATHLLQQASNISAFLVLRGLFDDGPRILVSMLRSGPFVLSEPARWATHVLQQAPTVVALKLGMMDLIGLARLYSATMELLPLAFVAGSYLVLPKGKKAFFVFPLIFYLAGAQAAAFEPLAEGPTVTAYFWFLLFVIVFRARTPVWQIATLAAAIPAVQSHEVMVFLAPVLAFAALRRAAAEAANRSRLIFRLMAAWFGIVAVAQLDFTLFHSYEENRASFIASTLAMKFVAARYGVNVPTVLGILAIVIMAVLPWLGGPTAKAWKRWVSWILVCAFAVTCLAAVIGTAETSYLFQPSLQFEARNYGAFISLPLAAIFLAYQGRAAALLPWTRPAVLATLACLALGQFGWHAIGLGYWAEFLDKFGEILASHRGMVGVREAEAAGLKPMSWPFTYPSLSIVLSPNGHVASMIVPPKDVKWQRFDSANPRELPQSRWFDMSIYRETLVPDSGTPR